MRNMLRILLILSIMAFYCQFSYAAEHGGKEHGGAEHDVKEHEGAEPEAKEHGGAEESDKEHGGLEAAAEPSADDIRGAMMEHVFSNSAETGTFDAQDPETNTTRRLALIRVHERVGKTGDYYYSCADFHDVDTGELLDLDLDVENKDGVLSVVDVRVHKVNGKERYTYDENDNRIPISE